MHNSTYLAALVSVVLAVTASPIEHRATGGVRLPFLVSACDLSVLSNIGSNPANTFFVYRFSNVLA